MTEKEVSSKVLLIWLLKIRKDMEEVLGASIVDKLSDEEILDVLRRRSEKAAQEGYDD